MIFTVLTSVLVGLGVILIMSAGARRLLTRGLTWSRRPGRPEIEVLSRTALGQGQGLAVVRAGSRRLLVSVGDGGVRLVTELESESASSGEPAPLAELGSPARQAMRALTITLALGIGIGVLPDRASADAAVSGVALFDAQQGVAPPQESAVQELQETDDLLSWAMGALSRDEDAPLRLEGPVGMVVFIGMMAILPTLMLLMTSFTRILVVLHFMRQALGTQTAPPGHLLAALALLLTGFVMAPTMEIANREAIRPWSEGQIEQAEMLSRAQVPLRDFMLRQTREDDLVRLMDIARMETIPASADDVPLTVLMSAFVTSELRAAFQIGFAIYLPFVVIDLVVASVLMSMGMFMLPPVMISLPLKLLLFVLADGWGLVVQGLVSSFS